MKFRARAYMPQDDPLADLDVALGAAADALVRLPPEQWNYGDTLHIVLCIGPRTPGKV